MERKKTKRRKRPDSVNYTRKGKKRVYKRRKRKVKYNIPLIFVLVISIILIFSLLSYVFKDKNFETASLEETKAIKLDKKVMVEGVNIKGMSKEEAYQSIVDKYPWDMQVVLDNALDKSNKIENVIAKDINDKLDDIYSGKISSDYQVNLNDLKPYIDEEVNKLSDKLEVKPQSASLVAFNKESNSFEYKDGSTGFKIDKEKLTKDILDNIQSKNYNAVITAKTTVDNPEILSKEQVKEKYKVIGTYTTKTTSNNDRNTNISIVAKALDGLIIKPNEEFSFNKTTGNRTLDKGYKPAGAYLNGVLVLEPGGGVCQVSSTLYNAVVFSGLNTTERHAHSFEPSYVTPGEDAMVSYDGYSGPDMKFVNNSPANIAIRAKLVDRKLTISIVGLPILGDNEKIYMTSTKVSEYDAPAPTYEEDATLEVGNEVIVKNETKGSKWVTNIVHKKDGAIISDKLLHNSRYLGKPAIIKRNSSGAVNTETNVGETTAESNSVIETIESPSETISNTVGNTNQANDKKPKENIVKPKVDSKKTETANVKPKADNKKSEITNVKPKSDTKKTEVTKVKPKADTKKSEVSNVKPKADNKKPEVSNVKPQENNAVPKPQETVAPNSNNSPSGDVGVVAPFPGN